ncbi:carbohydrate-binding domain-containing protein [Streptococcus sp. H31]|uniref:carbohydrate-binding domain-containing protein n=1 Tax=Streptococcus huangxiaojuni TaxID=3237239 RepID=UPI0034A2CEBF
MLKTKTKNTLFALCSASLLVTAACSAGSQTANTSGTDASVSAASQSTAVNKSYFTDEDSKTDYDDTKATKIQLTDSTADISGDGASLSDSVVTISKAGTYLISGSSENVQIKIAAADSDDIHLVFDNITMTGNKAAIYAESAQRVYITLAQGTDNSISDSSSSEADLDAAIYSKTALTFNGTGSLTVNSSNNNAVKSEADIHVTGGSYELTAAADAIKADHELNIANTTMVIKADDDAIKSDNDDDLTLGNLYLANNHLTISAGDDAVHASGDLVIDSGDIDITEAKEGLEGKTITINDGNFTLNTDDDAINAANSNANQEDISLVINGGNFDMTTSGDGIDSNHTLEINGGTIYINAATNTTNNALDYETEGIITGGRLLFLGDSQMAQGFSDSSTQASIMENIQGSAGSKIRITDSDGNELLAYTATQDFQNILASSPEMADGETYTITVDDQTVTATAALSTAQEGMMEGGAPNEFMP